MKTFQELATDIGTLVEEKNKAYGSAFDKAGDFIRLLYPEGIKPDQYKDMLCTVRIFDKLMRIATSYEDTEEKKIDAYSDIMGYALLGLRSSILENNEEVALRNMSTLKNMSNRSQLHMETLCTKCACVRKDKVSSTNMDY
jgi:hypothetical protein